MLSVVFVSSASAQCPSNGTLGYYWTPAAIPQTYWVDGCQFKVYYCKGYDPAHPGIYTALYISEIEKLDPSCHEGVNALQVLKDIEDKLFSDPTSGLTLDWNATVTDYAIVSASCMKKVCNHCTPPPDPMNPPTESMIACGGDHYCVKKADLYYFWADYDETYTGVTESNPSFYQVGIPTCDTAPNHIWDWEYGHCYLVCTY